MDVNKIFKTIHNLNDYISATQIVINKNSNSKIQFNMSTVLSLKKIRSFEIEYFNKCDESGAGIKILEIMLRLPPSKTWSLLGKELVLLIQYWLEAIRKHLIRHNNNWWNFLSTLLKFIQDIRSKHTVLSNILVQDLSECLLDLATNRLITVVQRLKILQCYNSVCAESSRELRYVLRNKFGNYFVKLSSIMPSCGDIRAQYSIMETLLRWLLPRQDLSVKQEAAAKWFPKNLYNDTARKIFIERPWQNFFKDAREFLNAHNMNSDLITTVICRRFCIGNVTLISDTEKDYYIDINTSTEIISLMVEPTISDVLGTCGCDAVIISKDNTNTIRMYRESSKVFISVNIMDPQLLYLSTILIEKDIQMVISSRSDLVKLNRTLRRIFDTKYELFTDLEIPHPTSPPRGERKVDNISVDKRFSNPVELMKRKRSGYIVRPRVPSSWKSPSTASTSSLALLREKLTALPGYNFDKEPVSVCALPQLSSVTEVTEDNATFSTYKLRSYGVCKKKYKSADKSSKSDDSKCRTTINYDENNISCLIVATIGPNDSVINDTLERLPKDKEIHTDNIVELLAKEALQSNDPKLDSDIVTGEKIHSEVNSNIIEDSQQVTKFVNEKTFVSTSATDVTSNDVIENTQFVIDRKDIKTISSKEKSIIHKKQNEQTYDIQAVEDFFSQYCSQNNNCDLLISPTLAKRINETSSESSLDFDIPTPMSPAIVNSKNELNINFYNTEIVDCLNDMVDNVCEDIEKCTQFLAKGIEHLNVYDKIKEVRPNTPTKEIQDMAKPTNKVQKKNTRIKLQYKNTKPIKGRGKKQKKAEPDNFKRMTTILEKDSDIEKRLLKNSSPESKSKRSDDYETPLIRRKHTLYLPKVDRCKVDAVNESKGIYISETEDDNSNLTGTGKVDNNLKSLATPYKEIEKLRRISTRNRKSLIDLSPRSKKNVIFDNLRKTVEGEENIILADKKTSSRNKKLAVYNFSSDSEDDDFQKRKGSKKYSSAVRSLESVKNTRARISKSRNLISKETNKHKKNKNRKSKSDIKKQISKTRNDMIDERIREAVPEALNTSLMIEQDYDLKPKPLEPLIHEKPHMEIIEDKKDLPTKRTRRKKPTNLSLKKEKVDYKAKNVLSDKEPSVRSSPLPGLIIETVEVQIHKDPDDSINVLMLEKYKDIYNNERLPNISEIHTTHNLLSDLEQITYDANLNITEEIKPTKRSRNDVSDSPKAKKSKLNTTNVTEDMEPQIITISEVSYVKSDKSIATIGQSPITGHGDSAESPPNTDQLKQHYEPRGLETQDLSQSMKDYYNKLTKDIYEVTKSSHLENSGDKTIKTRELEESPIKLANKQTNVIMPPIVSIMSPKEISRWLPPRVNSVFGSNQSSENDHPVRITRSYTRSQDKRKSGQNSIQSPGHRSSKIIFHKSAISPIKMFDEVNKDKSVISENNEYVEHIKNIVTTKREDSRTINIKSQSPRYDLRQRSRNTKNSDKTLTEYSNKITWSSSFFEVTKKAKSEAIISDFESGHGSSIIEWFNRNEVENQNQAENTDNSLKDNLENIMEKLETTLTEIHHKSSKKFVSMFVDAQKHLTDLKEQRRKLYKQTALEVVSDIVKVMDTKFGELEQRSQDLDQQFIDSLKENASEVMRADCLQKKVMVSLLKEDVQTVLNHINKNRNTNM